MTLVTPSQMTGIGHYLTGLLEGLGDLEHAPADRYVVFAPPGLARRLPLTKRLFDLVPVAIPHSPRLVMRPAFFAWQNSLFHLAARRHRLDVVHVPNLVPALTDTRRLVMTIGDLTEHHVRGKYPPLRQAYRTHLSIQMARRAAHVVTFSDFTRADIVSRTGVSREKVSTTPLAVPSVFDRALEREAATAAPATSRGRPYVLHLGKLLPHKNVERLVAAMAILAERGLPHGLVLAGPKVGRDRALVEAARQRGIADRVSCLGYVSYDEAAALCRGAAAVAVPSLSEGFGLAVLEAMRAGAPVVASRACALPEVAGEAALFVDPLSSASIADGLERVLCNGAFADRLRARGTARAACFSWRECARRTRDVYRQVMGRDPAR